MEYLKAVLAQVGSWLPYLTDLGAAAGRMAVDAAAHAETFPIAVACLVFGLGVNRWFKGTTGGMFGWALGAAVLAFVFAAVFGAIVTGGPR